MLNINSLSLKKGNAQILKNLNLTAHSGQVTLLLGKSGSGKTSLLRCIAQIEKEYTGQILCFGKDVSSFDPKTRCQTFGYVSQSYGLFPHMTIFSNCAEPLSQLGYMEKAAVKEKVMAMLEQFGIAELKSAYPYQTSGGQQQRAALARTLLLNPLFVLLDEPTSALDPENTQILINFIRKWKEEGVGWLISTQDMAFAKELFDQPLFLEDGTLLQQHSNSYQRFFSLNL